MLFRSPQGSVELSCYWPHRLAWVGRSLLVSTMEWDVLLFEHLMDRVEAMVGGPARLSAHRRPHVA